MVYYFCQAIWSLWCVKYNLQGQRGLHMLPDSQWSSKFVPHECISPRTKQQWKEKDRKNLLPWNETKLNRFMLYRVSRGLYQGHVHSKVPEVGGPESSLPFPTIISPRGLGISSVVLSTDLSNNGLNVCHRLTLGLICPRTQETWIPVSPVHLHYVFQTGTAGWIPESTCVLQQAGCF